MKTIEAGEIDVNTAAKTLREMRLERGWSLRAMAEHINATYADVFVDHGQLGRLERGETKAPYPPLRVAINDLFGLTQAFWDDRAK